MTVFKWNGHNMNDDKTNAMVILQEMALCPQCDSGYFGDMLTGL